jgi:isobutyryl-CoA mutase
MQDGPAPGTTSSRPSSAQEAYVPRHRVRFITAASLFDGHDASINIMRRILQSAGAEVIHLGHNRSAREIVDAALQEDAQAIAISSYQGGHVEYFKYVVDLLKEGKAPHVLVFGGGGGTITAAESEELHRYGVARLYSPEDGRKLGLGGIIADMVKRADFNPLDHVDWACLKDRSTLRRLANALTCVEQGEPALTGPYASHLAPFQAMRADCAARAKTSRESRRTCVVGLTGTGGAGKSSLTDEISLRLLQQDPAARIAIVATDPTRKKTGGALLGDRLRINSLKNPRLFMRSLATREANVSLSRASQEAVDCLAAEGFDWVLVETGGIGQADTSIVDLVDIRVYVMTSEFGAPTQLEKINMLDYADLVVLNKFDKGGSLDALGDVRKQLRRNHRELEALPPARYPVFGTIASRFNDPGVDAIVTHLVKLRSSDKKLLPLDHDFELENPMGTTIVPKNRVQYLSEITGAVRDYHKETSTLVDKVLRVEAAQTLKGSLTGPAKDEVERLEKQAAQELPAETSRMLAEWPEIEKRYRAEVYTYGVRDHKVSMPLFRKSLSQNKIPRISLPRYRSKADLVSFLRRENLPGYFPYTAGVFPLKREGEAPKRMFAGEGTPTRTNKRFHLLCAGEKAKRLSTAFDSVTLYGQDPDRRPDIYGKIGESGVSICTLDDAKKLYAGFDLCDPMTSVSMTINGPAPMLLAFFFNTAIDQRVERFEKAEGRRPSQEEWERIAKDTLTQVRGTVQADILKEDQAQNTCIFSTAFALRMMGDIQEYFIRNNVRNYYSVSISGYHIAEAGANPVSQLAFTLANGFTFVEYYLARGMRIDDFAPNLSFFFSNGLDPEYTVIGRVARRIWAIAMKRLYGGNDRSQKLKYHIQTSGRSLHAQEIAFNDIRTTLQALLAYFDHCNSLHTNAYDEAITTPTEESVRRAMAIQLVLTEEFGWTKNENPLQGSFIVEELTELVEEAVLAEFDRLTLRGGVLGAMETQYQRSKIQEESLHYEQLKHSGELPIVGVNTFLNPGGVEAAALAPENLTRASYAEKDEQIANLRKFHAAHAAEAPAKIAELQKVARSGKNLFAALMSAARVCSLGQLSQALYEIGGEYRRSM